MTPAPATPLPPNPASEQLNEEWGVIEDKLAEILAAGDAVFQRHNVSDLVGDDEHLEE